MPERTEFEEKEYEHPLNHQLLLTSNNLWTPGQVFEKVFGIDAAIRATNIHFWNLFGYSYIPDGTSLASYDWNFLWRFIHRAFKKFPSFNVNLLIQAKRPSYRLGVNAEYAKNGIKKNYWQFKVTNHQQKILEQLENKLATNALVIYASPSFHKFDELERHITSGTLSQNSTFVKPSNLTGHTKWVYDKAGTTGLCCSKIKKHFDNLSLEAEIEKLLSLSENQEQENSSEFNTQFTRDQNMALKNLKKIERACLEVCEELKDNPVANAYLNRRKRLLDFMNSSQMDSEEIRTFNSIMLFNQTVNLSWLTM